jgi:mannose-6-phosphate isomerase-like protein (cupin superfamily)
MLAMLFVAATGAWAQEWISGITNGDFSGDDVSSFCKKEYPSTDVVPVVIGANVGKDGTPGIVVKSGDDTANPNAQNYDTQLWIVLSEEIPAGSTIRVQFDYKASKAVKGSTEYHADPGSYLTWQAIGDVNFTTEWKTFSGEFTIPKEADGMKSIAFKLQEEKSATDYYFDNFSVSYKKTQWTNIVANSDMEGTDVSCFYVKEQGGEDMFLPRITEGIGMDGSRAIKVQSSDNEPNSWDTQFHIRLPYVLPAGTMYRLSFDYKTDKAGEEFGFQLANEPNQYIWWTLDGWPAPSISTDESNVNKWQHYKKVFVVPAECDGVTKADDNDWLRQFRTIYVNLAGNKVATESIFDNVKVEILSNVVSTLTPEPVTDPKLMIPYYDDDDVAVGKLKAAIETYNAIASPTADDKATLKAAINQFNADNADQEKDETAKVNTAGWKTFDGSDAGLAPDLSAPAVTTYDKRSTQPAEVYEGSADGVNRTGIIIYQDITGLANGQYKVGFYGTSYYTNGRGFESTMEDGSTDVAYVFANEQKKFITARVGTSFSEYNLLQFNVTVADGNIKLGLGKEKGGSNWHTMQIYQLTWFATAQEAYAASQTELKALLTDAEALAADENKTEGKNDLNTAIANAEEATTTKADWYNNTEIEAIIADLKTAIANFKKATYTVTFAAANVNTIESGKATVKVDDADATLTDGKITDVKAGQTIILNAKQGYKFRKVETKKKVKLLSITIGAVTVYYAEGESWANAIKRDENKDSGLFIREGNRVHHPDYGQLVDSNTQPVLPDDKIIATETYSFVK